METIPPSPRPKRRSVIWQVIAVATLVWVIAVAMLVGEAVSLSRDAGALRNEMLAVLGRPAGGTIQFSVGPALLSVARLGVGFAHRVPQEAQRALQVARSASVGIYSLQHHASAKDRARMFAAAEDVMSRRGWTRIVGVNNANQTVAIYAPNENRGAEQRLCLAVCADGKLVVVDACVDAAALVEFAGRFAPRLALQ